MIERCGRRARQELVGPFLVVAGAKGVDGPLLRGERRLNRVGFESFVHAFVRAVLLRMSGENALVLNAESHPPHVEL